MKRLLFFILFIFSLALPVSAESKTVATPMPESTDIPSVAETPVCTIKGNVNSKGEKIYHCRNWRDYKRTKMKPEEGDRIFCTEAEARAAGFRAARYAHGICLP
jgi:hypothetical protein